MVSLEDIKLPPHNIDAEKGVLCGAFMDNELMYYYDGVALIPEDFYQREHFYIYQAIKELRAARKTVDVLTVADQLGKSDLLDTI